MCFIDYLKVFDCVSHSQLWTTLIKMAFLEREIGLIKNSTRDKKKQYTPTSESQNGLSLKEGSGKDAYCHLIFLIS